MAVFTLENKLYVYLRYSEWNAYSPRLDGVSFGDGYRILAACFLGVEINLGPESKIQTN